jgi:hypothetical protein
MIECDVKVPPDYDLVPAVLLLFLFALLVALLAGLAGAILIRILSILKPILKRREARQWAAGSGQQAVGSRQWAAGSGQQAVGSRQWAAERAERSRLTRKVCKYLAKRPAPERSPGLAVVRTVHTGC